MSPADLATLISETIGSRRLLAHPFYRRWEEGGLRKDDLAGYAEQYRHIEAALPGVLSTIATSLPNGRARKLTEDNLADELGRPAPHLELFDAFAAAVGAQPGAGQGPATHALVELQITAARHAPEAGLAVLAAYESQAAEVAASKAEGLRRHYEIKDEGARFWDVHASMEATHASWSFDVLSEIVDDPGPICAAAESAAAAWWDFLDERETASEQPPVAVPVARQAMGSTLGHARTSPRDSATSS